MEKVSVHLISFSTVQSYSVAQKCKPHTFVHIIAKY